MKRDNRIAAAKLQPPRIHGRADLAFPPKRREIKERFEMKRDRTNKPFTGTSTSLNPWQRTIPCDCPKRLNQFGFLRDTGGRAELRERPVFEVFWVFCELQSTKNFRLNENQTPWNFCPNGKWAPHLWATKSDERGLSPSNKATTTKSRGPYFF